MSLEHYYNRISEVPDLPDDLREPMSFSWVFILGFSTYSTIMLAALSLVVADFSLLYPFREWEPFFYFLLILCVNIVLSILLQLLGLKTMSNKNYYSGSNIENSDRGVHLPGAYMILFFILYMAVSYILGSSASFLSDPITMIAGVDALLMGTVFDLYFRPIVPEIPNLTDRRSIYDILESHHAMWWRMMRLVMTYGVTLWIGGAIGIFVSIDNRGSLSVLYLYLLLAIVPFALLFAYANKKNRVMEMLMRQALTKSGPPHAS